MPTSLKHNKDLEKKNIENLENFVSLTKILNKVYAGFLKYIENERNLNTGDSIEPRVCQVGMRTSIRTVIFSDITESLFSLVKFWTADRNQRVRPNFQCFGIRCHCFSGLGLGKHK